MIPRLFPSFLDTLPVLYGAISHSVNDNDYYYQKIIDMSFPELYSMYCDNDN